VFFGFAALFMKRSPFISPWIASLIDEKLGAGSSEAFMVRLQPLLMFSVAGLIGSAAMAKGCWQSGRGANRLDDAGVSVFQQRRVCIGTSDSASAARARGLVRWRVSSDNCWSRFKSSCKS
jgi:hypothetical protein